MRADAMELLSGCDFASKNVAEDATLALGDVPGDDYELKKGDVQVRAAR